MKILKPLPHGVLDYAMAGSLIAAPWLFGFKKNKTATIVSVSSGAAILGLSLFTRYPLGAVGLISFPTHGTIETIASGATAAAPWLLGYADNSCAKWTHLAAGLGTLGVVAMTDYYAQEGRRVARRQKSEATWDREEPARAGIAEQQRSQVEHQPTRPDLGPAATRPGGVSTYHAERESLGD